MFVNSDSLYRLAKEFQAQHLRWAERERLAIAARRSRGSRRRMRFVSPIRLEAREFEPNRAEAS